jgi:hypothetical protein
MFFPGSRYLGLGTYQVTLADGSAATATCLPLPRTRTVLGWHRRIDGERLDLLAYRYLQDATGSWVLCDTGDAIVPDSLAAHPVVAIPAPGS